MEDLDAVVDDVEHFIDQLRGGGGGIVEDFLGFFLDVLPAAAFGVGRAGVFVQTGRTGEDQAFDLVGMPFGKYQRDVSAQGIAQEVKVGELLVFDELVQVRGKPFDAGLEQRDGVEGQ